MPGERFHWNKNLRVVDCGWKLLSKGSFCESARCKPVRGLWNKVCFFHWDAAKGRQGNIGTVVIYHPQVLGDTYDEIIECLSCLAEAELSLHITSLMQKLLFGQNPAGLIIAWGLCKVRRNDRKFHCQSGGMQLTGFAHIFGVCGIIWG